MIVAQCSRPGPRARAGRVHVGEDHALGLELLVDLVVDDLGLVLGADPERNLRSASGMPSRSKVFLMSSGTSLQSRLFFSEARTK